jgi:hypothetical protein
MRVAGLLLMIGIAAVSQAAEACSIPRGVDPTEVKQAYDKERRKGTIRVRGVFHITPDTSGAETKSQDEDDSVFNAEGILVSRNGKKTYKVYVYDEREIRCWGPS